MSVTSDRVSKIISSLKKKQYIAVKLKHKRYKRKNLKGIFRHNERRNRNYSK